MSDYKELIFSKYDLVLRFFPVSIEGEHYYCPLSAYDIDNFQKWIKEEEEKDA